jgi:hypothetical protein
MIRYLISLEPEEATVLYELAASEMRDPRDQIRFMLRMELERRGLLPVQGEQPLQPANRVKGVQNEADKRQLYE